MEVSTFWSSLYLPTPYSPTSGNYQYLGIWAWIFFFLFFLLLFIFYGEIFVEICGPFFKIIVSLLSFLRYLCILDKSPLSNTWFANIFPSVHQAKFGIKFNFSIFSFIDCTFNGVAKNVFQYSRSLKCSPIFFRIF